MTRSSLLAAAIMFFGLLGFVVLVSGGSLVSEVSPPSASDVVLAATPLEDAVGPDVLAPAPDYSPSLVSADGR